MADTTFSTGVVVTSDWLNDLNDFFYTLFQASTTPAEARAALGITDGTADLVVNDLTVNGDLTVLGNTEVNDLTVLGDLVVEGTSTFNDDVTINGDLEITGLITNNGNPIYSGVPQNSQNAGYTLVLLDQGKHINMATAGAFTIPANASVAFPIGSIISFYNPSASSTITITSDTLRFAADGTTGTRTVAQYGIATILKVGTTTWVISGQGVT